MILVDAHLDIAYNAISFNRDYRLPAYKTRAQEDPAAMDIRQGGPGLASVGLPDGLLARTAVVFATVFTMPDADKFFPLSTEPTYKNVQQAYDNGQRQLDYYERLTDDHEQLRLIRTAADLEAVLATWAPDAPMRGRQQGLVLLMEGADPIVAPEQFEEWYERGLRAVGPAWSTTRYAYGDGDPGPLTPLGYDLLEAMADANALLDTSHLAERAFFQALDAYPGPLMASHSNPRKFYDSERNLSDEQIRALAERDGVIGVVAYNVFLDAMYRRGDKRTAVPFTRLLDVIDHVCQVTGSAQHVGIGSDMDGGFGLESVPLGMGSNLDLWWITTGLRERGYAEADIEAVAGGNFLRKLGEALPRG